MNIQKFHAFVYILAITLTGAQSPPRRDDLSAYCGLQHHDDYFEDTNGTTAFDEFPWVAGLIYQFLSDGAKGMLCAGALINRRYVVTAAQCLTHSQESSLIAVRLGEYHIKNVTDCAISDRFDQDCTKAVDYGIEDKIVHGQYNQEKRLNDIALLRLHTRINEFTDYIRPICVFPSGASSANVGNTLFVTGWGRKKANTEPAEIKKKISTVLITNEECANEFGNSKITDDHICTKDSINNTEFTCQGDAGAPVMFASGPILKWHLVGISVWGGICGPEHPRVHTRVANYINWIEENMLP